RAFIFICQMGIAAPSYVFAIGAGVHSSSKGITTFITDDFSGKCIALLIFLTFTLDTFFSSSLCYQKSCSFKILFTDNCFMMVSHVIHIQLTLVCMPVERIIGIGFLEDNIAGVFLVRKN